MSSAPVRGMDGVKTVLTLMDLGGEAGDQPLDSYRPTEMVVAGKRQGGRRGTGGLGGEGGSRGEYLQGRKNEDSG